MTKKDYNPIKEFDEQIKSELRYNKNDIKKCPSYWAKKLFIETQYFNQFLDLNKREFLIFLPLILGTLIIGLKPTFFLSPMHMSVNVLIELLYF